MKEFIEKLIGRLEENTIYDKQAIAFMNKYGRGIGFISKKKAIEIVNQLAEEYNNDFCEWHKQEGFYLFKTSCGIKDADNDHYKFCPYCSKKIKIAPYQPKGE